jgi:hypothetical protein
VLIALDAFSFLSGRFIMGFWYALIGLFFFSAAGQTCTNLLVPPALAGEPVRRFMSRNPITVSSELSVRVLVDDHFFRDPDKPDRKNRLLALEGDRLICILVLKDLLKLVAFRMDLERLADGSNGSVSAIRAKTS